MTERIREFLRNRVEDGPCLVVDLDVVRDNYTAFAKALPDTRVFYAVKANPAPEIVAMLCGLGSSFDVASRGALVAISDVDESGLADVAGTVAGENTIFVAARDGSSGADLEEQFRHHLEPAS